MIKKTVDVEAKSAFWPRFSTKKIDQNCFWGNQLTNSTIANSQNSTMKEFWVEKSNVQDPESSIPQRFNNNESSKKAWKEKKKKQCQKD